MKKNIFNMLSGFAILGFVVLIGCNQAPKGDEAKIGEKQQASSGEGITFVVDTANSKIRFTGHGVGKNHPGIFKLSSGQVKVDNNQITAGNFVIRIHSLKLEQKDEMVQTKLRPHLLSGDFFDAEKFGDARFEITKVEPYKPNQNDTSLVDGANFYVSGNLKLKDVTKNITFPARVELDDNTLKGKANFDIDRRQWQMNYRSDKTLGDKFISETVNIELDLEARRDNTLSLK
jgi:polyisoprenoid-binding protein YceI